MPITVHPYQEADPMRTAIRRCLVLMLVPALSCTTAAPPVPAPFVPDLAPLADAYQGDSVDEQPVVRWSENPEYPADLVEQGTTGLVVLEAVVLKSGRVRPTQVIHSPDDRLTALAVATLRKWIFHPGRIDGQPVAVVMEVEFSFDTWGRARAALPAR